MVSSWQETHGGPSQSSLGFSGHDANKESGLLDPKHATGQTQDNGRSTGISLGALEIKRASKNLLTWSEKNHCLFQSSGQRRWEDWLPRRKLTLSFKGPPKISFIALKMSLPVQYIKGFQEKSTRIFLTSTPFFLTVRGTSATRPYSSSKHSHWKPEKAEKGIHFLRGLDLDPGTCQLLFPGDLFISTFPT